MNKLNYFLPSEITSMTKEEIALQGTLGIQQCKTKEDAKGILLDIWNLGQLEVKKEIAQTIDRGCGRIFKVGVTNCVCGQPNRLCFSCEKNKKEIIGEDE